MFTIPALVTLGGGGFLAVYLGFSAFKGFRNKLDTRDEAMDFLADLAGTIVGLCAVVTAVHALVA